MLAYSKYGLTIEVYASDFTAELQPNKECHNKFNTRVALEATLRHWALHFKGESKITPR